jgi:hypothetical protein
MLVKFDKLQLLYWEKGKGIVCTSYIKTFEYIGE